MANSSKHSFARRTFVTAVGAALVTAAAGADRAFAAASGDPAAAQIATLNDVLLATLKQGKALGYKGRYARLKPALERTFDINTMIRFAVGPAWATMTEAQHQALLAGFTRLTVASYAHNFKDFTGQKFDVDSTVETRGPDKLVRTHVIPANGTPVAITYRMREINGVWRVIDVYYKGAISELTTRRSDFAATLASGGEPALAQHLNKLADNLERET